MANKTFYILIKNIANTVFLLLLLAETWPECLDPDLVNMGRDLPGTVLGETFKK